MALYILDTNIWSLYRKDHSVVKQRVKACPPSDLALTVISVEEQFTGWQARLRHTRKRDILAQTYREFTETVQALAGLTILSFTEPAMIRYEQLKAQKLNVAKMDLRIAAITLEYGGTLVTRNRRDFQRVPGLPLEDWSV